MENCYDKELNEYKKILEATEEMASKRVGQMLGCLVGSMETFCSSYREAQHVRKRLEILDAKLSTDTCEDDCDDEDEDDES